MSKKENNVKGHGYLRKTKLGLASGIVLGATLFVGAGVASADEIPATTPNNNVATAQTNDTKEVVVDNDLTKVAEEAKKTGVQVEKEPTKNIGTAKTETEAEALQKKAEAEVNAQKTKIQDTQKKYVEENKAVDHKLATLKEVLHTTEETYSRVANDIGYIQDKDYLNGKVKIGEIKSSKGSVDFVNVPDKLPLSEKREDPNNIFSLYALGKTDKPKEAEVSDGGDFLPQLSPIPDKSKAKLIPTFVSPNETVTYRVEFADDSELAKMGIKYKEVKFTLKSTGTDDKDSKIVAFLSPYGSSIKTSGGYAYAFLDKKGNGQPFEVENVYNFLDKDGKVIDKKTLGQQWINKLRIKGVNLDKSYFPDAPLVKEGEIDGGELKNFTLKTEYGKDDYFVKWGAKFRIPYENEGSGGGQIFHHIFTAEVPKELDPTPYIKKQEKASYHLVSYNVNKPKATNNADKVKKGSITQVFVGENGKEIASRKNTGEKPVDEAVKLTHPNEIVFEGKTYTFAKQDKVDPTKIPNGAETITYTYKLKETPKPTPAPTPTPVEKPVTVHIDRETGKEIAPKEEGTKPFKNIDGYEPAPKDSKNVENPKGKTVRVYNAIKKGNVEVRYVKDDASKTLLQNPVADTVGGKVGSDYDTTEHKKQTITKDGVTYELVRTEGAEKGKVVEGKTVVTYVYRQTVEPTTVHVDEEGNRLAPPEKGTTPFKEIEGYKPAPKNPKNVEDPKGLTVRVYEKVKPEAPQEAPKTPAKPEAPKPTAQANVAPTLPNTGSEASTALAIAGMGILGLSALAYKKKED